MKLYALLNIFLCFSAIASAQSIENAATIEYGSKNLTLDHPLLISVVLRDVETRPSVIFPEIKDLEKRSKSATSSVSTVDGRKVVIQTITQEYYAAKAGNYLIPEFNLTVNNVRLHSDETMVVFAKSSEDKNNLPTAENVEVTEADDNSQSVFLSVQTDRKEVYIRQGFAVRISLYIAENAPVEMEFYRFNAQLQGILKAIRPVNCWEENVGVEEIIKRKVTIRGRRFAEYNMYQARFFPITSEDIELPSVKLNMLVTESGRAVNVQNKLVKAFRSRPLRVVVKQLPDHPLRDQVAVGQYSLRERLSSDLVYPGESVRYMFKIEGVGNIKAIPAPVVPASSSFDIYPPEESQVVKRSYQSVIGEKTFDYFVVPRKDGEFPLGRYFHWIYFNVEKEKYDTLSSATSLEVRGDEYKLTNLSLSGSSGLYDNLENLDSSSETIDYKKILKDLTNILIVLLLVTMIWVFRK
ncbi:BatD family protein [Dyadobacter sp. CY261]|uniref:BatD family protein n=1 Tax=Dyadobacter sp. CY261 TaxID=2907203 RepID=UPI001F38066A|nr:BatD family protein [Dyadobacter sp. CY261]